MYFDGFASILSRIASESSNDLVSEALASAGMPRARRAEICLRTLGAKSFFRYSEITAVSVDVSRPRAVAFLPRSRLPAAQMALPFLRKAALDSGFGPEAPPPAPHPPPAGAPP